jgi:tRNA (guanine-N7-)-methyltransferase
MIKTFSSRAGRLSPTNIAFLEKESACLLKLGQAPETDKPVVIDIGFGDSQSFSQDVLKNPDYCFVGIEPYKKGFARAVEFYEKAEPDNLFLFNGDAREYIEASDYEISFIRIHFPDPWPKKKHTKRRLISNEFLTSIYKKINSGAKLEIITDSKPYQMHIKDLLDAQKLFEVIEDFEISYEVSTFHHKGINKGHSIERYVLLKN